MYSAYKLNKQSDNIQPWRTPFPIWNQSVVPCPVLTVASRPAYRFLKRQVRWSGIPISFRIFHSLLWSTQSIREMQVKSTIKISLQLSESLAAGVRTEPRTRIRGFVVTGFFADRAAVNPALQRREDDGPEEHHRPQSVQGPFHRLLHLLRPQETEWPQFQEQAAKTKKETKVCQGESWAFQVTWP